MGSGSSALLSPGRRPGLTMPHRSQRRPTGGASSSTACTELVRILPLAYRAPDGAVVHVMGARTSGTVLRGARGARALPQQEEPQRVRDDRPHREREQKDAGDRQVPWERLLLPAVVTVQVAWVAFLVQVVLRIL